MMKQSHNAIRPRKISSPRKSSSPCSSRCLSSETKNLRIAAVVPNKKNYQTKRRRPSLATVMQRSRRTAPRVRFSHPLVHQSLRIPRIDDEETKSRLYYSAMELARFMTNERIRRQLITLTVGLYKEQIKRVVHRRQLMPAYLITAIFQKMFSRIGTIAPSATITIGGASKATGATTTETPDLDDSAKRPTKRCRVEAEKTNTRKSLTSPRRLVFAQCA
jgi:hypothetical protein